MVRIDIQDETDQTTKRRLRIIRYADNETFGERLASVLKSGNGDLMQTKGLPNEQTLVALDHSTRALDAQKRPKPARKSRSEVRHGAVQVDLYDVEEIQFSIYIYECVGSVEAFLKRLNQWEAREDVRIKSKEKSHKFGDVEQVSIPKHATYVVVAERMLKTPYGSILMMCQSLENVYMPPETKLKPEVAIFYDHTEAPTERPSLAASLQEFTIDTERGHKCLSLVEAVRPEYPSRPRFREMHGLLAGVVQTEAAKDRKFEVVRGVVTRWITYVE